MTDSNRTKLTALTALIAMAAALPAQVFTVGGVGAAFPDIATAVASVPDGAILDVRPGTYTPFTIEQKSITVLGGPGVQISSIVTTVRVQNLTAGQQVTLQGLQLWSALASSQIFVTNNQGRVVLDRLTTTNIGASVSIVDSQDVRIRESTFDPPTPMAAVFVSGSNVRLEGCSLVAPGLPNALRLQDSTAELTDCTAMGGIWAAGVTLANSHLTVRGASSVESVNFEAIAGTGSVRIDPQVTLASGTTQPIAPTIVTTTRELPAVRATVGAPGLTTTATLDGPGSGYGWLFAGVPGPRIPIALPTGADSDALDMLPTSQALLADGPLANAISGSYTSPTLPALLGAQITWQGVSIDGTSGLQISNGVTYAHR